MIFDRQTTAPCVVVEPPPPDQRCNDAAFSLSHPDVCESALIIKPGFASLCEMDSVQFRVYEYKAGVETELTEGVTFSSSNSEAFTIGVNGGAGTALATGSVTITATYSGRAVSAQLEVLAGDDCCAEQRVLTSIVVDNSRSMSLNFGWGYSTRLLFAKAVAEAYGGSVLAKDATKVWSVNSTLTELLADFSSDSTAILAAVSGITQTQEKTDLLPVFVEAAQELLTVAADRRVLLLISDGEQNSTDSSVQDVLDAAALFKSAGGIVIVVAPRASGNGFDLLERVATGGYFINADSDTAADSLTALNYLKSLTCSGTCIPAGDVYANVPALNYSSFQNWEVLTGQVNLLGPGLLDLLPGHDLYVDMAAGSKATLRTIDSFELAVYETYGIALNIAGNQREAAAGQGLRIYLREVGAAASDPNVYEQVVYPEWDAEFSTFHFSFTAGAGATVKLYVEQLGDDAAPVGGNLIDSVSFENVTNSSVTLVDNFSDENLTYIPPRCGQSAAQAGIDNPDGPGVYDAPYNGTQTICNGDSYTYAVSWVTLGGETAASPITTLVSIVDSMCVVRVVLPTPPDAATHAHIWRNVADGDSSNLYLLATVNPHHETYFDLEDHATFLARYDIAMTPPASNTTEIEAGDLGTGFADCCYYASVYDDGPTQDIFSAEFVSAGAYLQRGGALTGAANNKLGTVSGWFKTDSAGVNFGIVGDNATEDLLIFVGGAVGNLEIDAYKTPHALILEFQSLTASSLSDNLWHHFVASWDLSNPARKHLYVDGFDVLNAVVFTDDTVNWAQAQTSIGLNNGSGDGGLVAELWIDNSYMDLSLEANRLKFRTASGRPAVLGLSGATPTGEAPLIYFRRQVPDWDVNQGSGGGFTETGAVIDGGADVPGGVVPDPEQAVLVFTDNCPDCNESALGPQASDPSPLPDIESGFTPPVVYTSTRTRCATCPNGFVDLASDGAEHTLVSNTLGATIVTEIHLTGAAINPYFYQIGGDPLWFPTDWTFEGSNDGSTWTVLDTRADQLFFPGEIKKVLVVGNSTAYAYYRYNISAWSGTPTLPQPPVTASDIVFPAAATPVCATVTETGTVNQNATDSLAAANALAAATELLNCSQIFSATRSFTGADCAYYPPGSDIPQFRQTTRSATRKSLISLADAVSQAQAAAESAVALWQSQNPCP